MFRDMIEGIDGNCKKIIWNQRPSPGIGLIADESIVAASRRGHLAICSRPNITPVEGVADFRVVAKSALPIFQPNPSKRELRKQPNLVGRPSALC
jgi:hypothetical protein